MMFKKIVLESGSNLESHKTPYRVTFDKDGEIELMKCAPGVSGDNIFYLHIQFIRLTRGFVGF